MSKSQRPRIRRQRTDWMMTSKNTYLLHGPHVHRVVTATIYRKTDRGAQRLCVVDDNGKPRVTRLDRAIPSKIIHIVPGDLVVFKLDPPLGKGLFYRDLDDKMEPLIEHLTKISRCKEWLR